MHLGLVIDNLGPGGAQRQLVELAVRLKTQHATRVSVAVWHPQDFFASRLRDENISLTQLPRRKGPDPLLPWRLRSWVQEKQLDVLHSFLLLPSLWSLLATRSLPAAQRPIFVAGERNTEIAQSPLWAAVQRAIYRRSDAVTANATPALEAIRDQLGVPTQRLHYIPNGIDLVRWDEASRAPSSLEMEKGLFHVALVGVLRHQKHHDLLFDALKRVPESRLVGWRIWCIGDDRVAPEKAAAIKQRCADDELLGRVVRFAPATENVAATMKNLHLLVLPSHFEGFPNVVLEAMASRLPVVATRVGDVPNLVLAEETGLVVDPSDPDAMATALLRIADLSSEARKAMGERGRAVVEARYKIGDIASRYLELYSQLLEH